MPHVTLSGVENRKIEAEKSYFHLFSFSRLNGKVDKNLSCFFIPFLWFALLVSLKGCILCYRLKTCGGCLFAF